MGQVKVTLAAMDPWIGDYLNIYIKIPSAMLAFANDLWK